MAAEEDLEWFSVAIMIGQFDGDQVFDFGEDGENISGVEMDLLAGAALCGFALFLRDWQFAAARIYTCCALNQGFFLVAETDNGRLWVVIRPTDLEWCVEMKRLMLEMMAGGAGLSVKA